MSNVLHPEESFGGWFKKPATGLWVNITRSISFTDEEMTAALNFIESSVANEVQRPVLMRLASKCLVEHLGDGVFEGTPALQCLQQDFQEAQGVCRAPGQRQ